MKEPSRTVPILHVAVPKPVRRCFDYLLPAGILIDRLQPGIRVLAPFGKKQILGILLSVDGQSSIPVDKLKPIVAILDEAPILSPDMIDLCQWASRYYQHPIGEVLFSAIPTLLRHNQLLAPKPQLKYYAYSSYPTSTKNAFQRSPKQAQLWTLLRQHTEGLTIAEIKTAGFNAQQLKALIDKGFIESCPINSHSHYHNTDAALDTRRISRNWVGVAGSSHQSIWGICEDGDSPATTTPALERRWVEKHSIQAAPQSSFILNDAQLTAINQIKLAQGFKPFLLQGVTGSGKTEVYLQVIEHVIRQGKQALILVPEIGLTPQTVARFEQRFPQTIVVLHSKLTEKARLQAWLKVKADQAQIVIGTRSAIFAPLSKLGVIVLDEEHDPSFKQQNGFRYSARDLAVLRGRFQQITVILGTATPSLETLHNTQIGRFERLLLTERAGSAQSVQFRLIDLRKQYLETGLSSQLLTAIRQHLDLGNQVLLFLNRRGFAPTLLCHSCGWSASCQRCDCALILHHRPKRLACHHCASSCPVPSQCHGCQQTELISSGYGTERVEQALELQFPQVPIVRIDRDSIRHKNAMEHALELIHSGQSQILLGTQMLAKGHHFPNVTLVGILDADTGLYSADFRGPEQMGQLITQVAGRAGRAEKLGEVYIQTHNPEHPVIQALIQQGYDYFAQQILAERRQANWPPYSALALLRAEATQKTYPLQFLQEAGQVAANLRQADIGIFGPIPAPMERKAGYYRALLLVQANQRTLLQRWLGHFIPQLEQIKTSGKVRWSIDVDPLEMF